MSNKLISQSKLLKVLSVGDLSDRLLINLIKIKNIGGECICSLKEEIDILRDVISYFTSELSSDDMREFKEVESELMCVLEDQWRVLDLIRDKTSTNEERGKNAVKAQDINIKRVELKNKINFLCGSFVEYKKYGNQNDCRT
tara:strand:+ start:1793 stop:2218 length:426 start_codon:yes stop_codon:yes gene_type:complete